MNPRHVHFPDSDQITAHAIAFAQMMFAHAALEREVRSLQGDITGNPAFGEQRGNQWKAHQRPARMVKLIKANLGCGLPETKTIKQLLTEAIDPSEQRNLLAHGEWWCFDSQTSIITVRGGIRFENDQEPPEQREYRATDIEALTERFKTIEAELYKLRSSIKRAAPNDRGDRGQRGDARPGLARESASGVEKDEATFSCPISFCEGVLSS